MYNSETRTMTETDTEIYEKRILRRIFGPINDGDGWRIRSNNEVLVYDDYTFIGVISSIRIS